MPGQTHQLFYAHTKTACFDTGSTISLHSISTREAVIGCHINMTPMTDNPPTLTPSSFATTEFRSGLIELRPKGEPAFWGYTCFKENPNRWFCSVLGCSGQVFRCRCPKETGAAPLGWLWCCVWKLGNAGFYFFDYHVKLKPWGAMVFCLSWGKQKVELCRKLAIRTCQNGSGFPLVAVSNSGFAESHLAMHFIREPLIQSGGWT